MTDTPLPGVPIDLPLPPSLCETLGYQHDARFVSLRWSYDHLIVDDGRSSSTGAGWTFAQYTRHRAVAGLLSGFDLGGSDHEAASVLLLDREANRASICRVSMPALINFNATRRFMGSCCSAMYTTPQPPSPIICKSL